MNIQFNQLSGKKYSTFRRKLTQLIRNLILWADIEEKNVSGGSVSTGRYRTDLVPETNGVQLRGNNLTEVQLTVMLSRTLFGVTIRLKNEAPSKLLKLLRDKSEIKAQMSLITGDCLFEKPVKPQPAQIPQIAPQKSMLPNTPPQHPETCNLKKDGVSTAFIAIVDSLDPAQKPFQKKEALEWLVGAKIGISNNRIAGRVLVALVRTGVIEEQESDTYILSDLGKDVASGKTEFPEVPPEKRVRKKGSARPEQSTPEQTRSQAKNQPEPSNDVDEHSHQRLADSKQSEKPTSSKNINYALEEFLKALEQESEAHRKYSAATATTKQCRALLAQHLPEAIIAQMENLNKRV